ncbi:MAG: DUF1512 domain-containing protein [Thermoprotei archaeon]|nr:MAG: DUF1512 domain-containing protein [Thermoprotei archaeon]RLF24506.1 MAG: DUF1512 domain-containing protein [Thermoprotei archaeon]
MNGSVEQWSSIYYMLSLLAFMFLILFNQRIQVIMWLMNITRVLKKLERMVDECRSTLINTMRKYGCTLEDLNYTINELLEFYVIEPVERDPFGVIRRLEHLINLQRGKFREIVGRLAPKADDVTRKNIENMIEASIAVNTLYRIVRHFFILGKKTKSMLIIAQLEMALPYIMRFAEAYFNAIKVFSQGKPLGDGIGPLVAGKLMLNAEKKVVKDDTVIAEVPFEGRRLIVIKALGPGGEVGKPGKVIEELVEENGGKVARIIMIDAALKLEGEKSGDVVEGIGAAIGDPGPEKFRIEEVATRYNIPLDAIIIKESLEEAVGAMKKEIAEAAQRVVDRVKELIRERTKEGDIVIVAGIGNTMGIGQ